MPPGDCECYVIRDDSKGGGAMKKGARRPRPRALLVTLTALVVLALGGWWLWPDASPSAGGTPKLVLDRTEIQLGYLRFNTPAYASFAITNAGDGPLTLKAGRVRVVEGC
jgi:hypothetical protein